MRDRPGSRAFVERRLPQASDRVELAFALRAGTISSAGTWTEIADVEAVDGSRMATIELCASERAVRLRVSAPGTAGSVVHSRPQLVSRRPTAITLALGPARATLSVDGGRPAAVARTADGALAEIIALGSRRPAGSRVAGYLDIDNVTVRSAHDAT